MPIALSFFILLFFLGAALSFRMDQYGYVQRENTNVLMVVCVVLVMCAGFRDQMRWADTYGYAYTFIWDNTPIWNYTFGDGTSRYAEKCFFFLGTVVKTFTDNTIVYFTFISALTFIFLYQDLKKYSVYPLLGLAVYVARFYCGRNMVQIRCGLSYAIVLLGLKYIFEKNLLKYLLVVGIAYLFHRSALIAIPAYFICNTIKLKKTHILLGLAIAFYFGAYGQNFLHTILEDNADDMGISDYVESTGSMGFVTGKGLLNPLIYFQLGILLVYMYMEDFLAPLSKYYYVFRDCYFYSTVILIAFCSYAVLSGRSATLFATVEFGMIPMMLTYAYKRYGWTMVLGAGALLSALFYLNFYGH